MRGSLVLGGRRVGGAGLGCVGVIQIRIWFSLGIAAKAEGAEGEKGPRVTLVEAGPRRRDWG